MSQTPAPETPPSEMPPSPQQADTTMAMVVYGLLLAGMVIGFTPLIGVVIAYVYRGKGPDWLEAHYRYQIRTFWIGLLYGVIATLLTLVVIGVPLLIALAVWMIIRCVKGFKGLQEERPPTNITTWLV
ncbi:MAG: DUF4870 domain-containing protein [Onishia taeanensis]|uniref:DUF4870 family protein n=1 Tax=Onishia taeanensis TaxID=284577 RepID=UPI003C7B175F